MSAERLTVEDFDGIPLDGAARTHLDFARRMDAVARNYGRRSYVIQLRCPSCALLAAQRDRYLEHVRTG